MPSRNADDKSEQTPQAPRSPIAHRHERPEVWEDAGGPIPLSVATEPTAREKMRFAQQLLVALGLIYVAAAATLVVTNPEHAEKIWFTTALVVTGVVSGIVGYFFGRR